MTAPNWGERLPDMLDMSDQQLADIAALRAYLRQWLGAPVWHGDEIEALHARIDGLTSRTAIDSWLADALDAGIDPL